MNNSKKSSPQLYFILSSALILFYIADGINKIILVGQSAMHEGDFSDSFSASIYFRFLYELFFLYFIYKLYDKERGTGILLLATLFISFLIGQLVFLLFYHNSNYSLVYHITLFNKYIFLFIIYYSIKDIVYDSKKLISLGRILEAIYVVNSLFILLGVALQINLFKSYFNMASRYGYDGLIASINEATLFYITGIAFLYFKYVNSGKGIWSLWICIIASLLMGAKAMYLFLFLLLLYHLIFRASIIQKIVSVGVIFFGILAALPVLLSDKYSYLYDVFVYQYEKEGFLATVTSGRSEFVMTKFIGNIDVWSFVNYFFGGTDQFKFNIEMDFLDAFLFLGIIGFSLLMALYFKTFFKNMAFKSFRFFFCLCYFLIAFLAGHFFSSAVNALYFNIAVLYIYMVEKNRIDSGMQKNPSNIIS